LGKDINGIPTPIIDPRTIDIEKDNEILELMGELSEKEIERIKRTIDRHTIHRDLNWYVGKATHVIAYYPDGSKVSKGVTDECTRAYQTGKNVYVVFHEQNKSPFMEIAHGVYRNEEEFFDFFKIHMEEKIREYRRKK
jgi:hypothetical protein